MNVFVIYGYLFVNIIENSTTIKRQRFSREKLINMSPAYVMKGSHFVDTPTNSGMTLKYWHSP